MSIVFNYKPNDKVGSCIYISDSDSIISKHGHNIACGLFKCRYCGNEFNAIISRVKSQNIQSCGCMRKKGMYTHGDCYTRIYRIWSGMKRRCFSKNYKRYHDYGGRGITVCDEWLNSYTMWFSYISKLPHYGEKGMTLDRINNDGNYEPGNVRWASKSTQVINSRIPKNNKSGFKGVHQRGGSFGCFIMVNRKRVWIGSYKSAIDAAKIRDKYIIENNLTEYKLQII